MAAKAKRITPTLATVETSRPRYLTLEEAGAIAGGAAPETVRGWVWAGKLRGFKPGRSMLVCEVELRAYIEGRELVAMRAAKGAA